MKTKSARTLLLGVWLCAGTVTTIAVAVAAGQLLRPSSLVSSGTDDVAMHLLAAVGFALCGVGLIAAARRGSRVLTRACGLATASLATLALAWHVGDLDIGLERWLTDPLPADGGRHPSHLAPNVAISFTLTGLALLLVGRPRIRRVPALLVVLLASFVLALGSLALVRHLGLHTAFGANDMIAMRPATACCFVLLAIGLLLRLWLNEPDQRCWLPPFAPLLAGATACVITVLMWQAVTTNEERHIRTTLDAHADQVAAALCTLLDTRLDGLRRMGGRLTQGQERDAWFADAANMLASHGSCVALEWHDEATRAVWVVERGQPAREEPLSGPTFQFDARGSPGYSMARGSGRDQILRARVVAAGGPYRGYLICDIDPRRLVQLQVVDRNVSAGYRIEVLTGTQMWLAGNDDLTGPGMGSMSAEREVSAPGLRWKVAVSPVGKTLEKLGSMAPTVTWFVGSWIALLLTLLTWNARTSLLRLHQLGTAHTALDYAGEGVASLDENNRYRAVNRAFARMSGYAPEQMIGMEWMPTIAPEDLPRMLAAHDSMLREGKGEAEVVGLRPDGSRFHERVTLVRNPHHDGPIGHFCFMNDITVRKQAEAKIRASEEMHRAIATDQNVQICCHDRDGMLTFVNVAFCLRVGKPEDELLGQPFASYRAKELPPLTQWKPVVISEEQTTAPDGSVRWHQWTDRAIHGSQQQVVTYQSVGLDITSLKTTEEKLRTALSVTAKRNEELDEFAVVASHDLQEPLRQLTAFAGVLREDLGSKIEPNIAEDLECIGKAASRMSTLVGDLLALSRTGRAPLTLKLIPLDTCVDQALENLEALIKKVGATVTRSPLPTVRGDATLLRQVFQNLLGNALKFVGTTPPTVEVTCTASDREVVIGVRDNGIGIKKEYLDRLFKPFVRLHGRAEFPGTGIGLAICRKAIERHGGEIWIESTPGVGSHFRFRLPLEGTGAAQVRSQRSDAPAVVIPQGVPSSQRVATVDQLQQQP